MKTCKKCLIEKMETEFYVSNTSKDRLRSVCKKCGNAMSRKWLKDNADKEKVRLSLWAKNNPEKSIEKVKRYRTRHPLISAAHDITHAAIRAGLLIKKPCETCGSDKNIHAHHDDYNKPLEVRWLCRNHHVELHSDSHPGLCIV